MQLQDYLRILRRRWMFILSASLMGLAVSSGVTLFQTPTYQATAQLFVSVRASATALDVSQGNSFAEKRVASYVSLAASPRVLQAVADDVGIRGGYQALVGKVDVNAPQQTVLIAIRATDADSGLAARIANSAAEELIAVVTDVEDISLIRLTIFEYASEPTIPVAPDVPVTLSLGVVLGFLVGLGGAVVRDVLDQGLRSKEDVAYVTSAGVLGIIPYEEPHQRVILNPALGSPRAEAFRHLRTNLHFTNISGGPQSIVVSSSLPGEGKSSTAVDLAITLADSGVRVLLIDADLRRPRVARYLGLESTVGLSTVLSLRCSLDDATQQWGPGGELHVLTAGGFAPNPAELLESPRMKKLISRVEDLYEVVIIDSPPVLPVADPLVLAALADGVLLITSIDGRTQMSELQTAIERVDSVNGRLIGVVLNQAAHVGSDRSHYDYTLD